MIEHNAPKHVHTFDSEFDALDFIMRLEGEGDLTADEVIDGFAYLIRTGMAWSLQGSYGRMAHNLILAGYIDHTGTVLSYPDSEF